MMTENNNPFQEILAQQGIMTMEAMNWTKKNAKSIQIGIPNHDYLIIAT